MPRRPEREDSREQTFRPPAPRPSRPSKLADFDWGPPPNVSDEDRAAFERDGFTVIRGAVDERVIDLLLGVAAQHCLQRLEQKGSCQLLQTRFHLDLLRDFLFYSPIGALAQSFLRGEGVRVRMDGLFSHSYDGGRSSKFFSFSPHIDTSGQVGLSGGLHSDSSSLHAWMPLHDVDPETTGGSISLVRGFPYSLCPVDAGYRETRRNSYNLTQVRNDCTIDKYWPNATTLSFRKGDIAFWHPNMLHATQPVLVSGYVRYAWFAFFANSDGILCNYHCSQSLPYIWGGEGDLPCCQHGLASGDRIHSPCFPQIHPSLVAKEVKAFFGSEPAPLVSKYAGDPVANVSYWTEESMSDECRAGLKNNFAKRP